MGRTEVVMRCAPVLPPDEVEDGPASAARGEYAYGYSEELNGVRRASIKDMGRGTGCAKDAGLGSAKDDESSRTLVVGTT
jgi:hypothetical protein